MTKTADRLPIDLGQDRLRLSLQDVSWPFKGVKEERLIARAVVMSGNRFLFAHVERDDMFGRLSFLETSGGGVKPRESLTEGLRRELREELGIECEIICYLGLVEDYYNLIGRLNRSNYFLVRRTMDVPNHLMPDEINQFHLQKAEVSLAQARQVYTANRDTGLGRLLYNREMPVLDLASQVIGRYNL